MIALYFEFETVLKFYNLEVRKSHRTFTVTRHLKDNKSKATSSLFLVKTIAKLETPGRVAQSVTCLVTDAKLTADPGVASSIPAWSHTFVEINHEIISAVILLTSAESFMKGCCQLQAKVCARLLVNCLFKLAQEKSVVR